MSEIIEISEIAKDINIIDEEKTKELIGLNIKEEGSLLTYTNGQTKIVFIERKKEEVIDLLYNEMMELLN